MDDDANNHIVNDRIVKTWDGLSTKILKNSIDWKHCIY